VRVNSSTRHQAQGNIYDYNSTEAIPLLQHPNSLFEKYH